MMKKDFEMLISTFKGSIKTWDYFINWKKVFKNNSEFEIILNKLNYLLGKEDLQKEFTLLLGSNPDIIKALPILIAVREKSFEVYDILTKGSEMFNFSRPEQTPEKYYEFIEKSGLAQLFQKDGIKNLVDYVIGVEVGLDSNGRKNRSGSVMEEIVETYVKDFCEKNQLEYISQGNAFRIYNKWGVRVNVDKSSRSFDFAIFNPNNSKIKLIETNLFNVGGSKLKTVCGEFRDLQRELKNQGIDFIWITDGLGWHTTKRPLEETYNYNDYVFNLSMLENDVLHELQW